MQLTVLTENVASGKYLAEHGLSYLIEYKGNKILFDTGHSDVFLKNAQTLGINLASETDMVVLSHGHWDHGDGLKYLSNKTLVSHSNIFMNRFRKTDKTPVGLSISKPYLETSFKLVLSEHPHLLYDGMLFLGEIPRLNNFEAQTTPFVDENDNPDFVMDDSAMVIIEKGALNIISGCAHSGICNIIDYAKKVTHCEKINAVIGGFHLKKNNSQTQQTIAYLKENKVKYVYPSHCTELPAMAAFYNEFNIDQLKTGMKLKL